jgi:hypothetical protein
MFRRSISGFYQRSTSGDRRIDPRVLVAVRGEMLRRGSVSWQEALMRPRTVAIHSVFACAMLVEPLWRV